MIPRLLFKRKAPTTQIEDSSTVALAGKASAIERTSQPSWKLVHQRVIGFSIFLYGIYLATLSGTATQFVLPGVGAIGGGAAAGAGVGIVTYLVLGTVGAVTGGAGVALGLLAMSLIGASLGAIGASAGGFGFRIVSYPLVSPWFWAPLIILGIYVLLGSGKRKASSGSRPA